MDNPIDSEAFINNSLVDGDENKKNKNCTVTDESITPKKPIQKIITNFQQIVPKIIPDTSEGLSEITDGNISSDQQSPIQGPKLIGKTYSKSFSSPSSGGYSVSTPQFTPSQTSRQASHTTNSLSLYSVTPKQRSIDSVLDHPISSIDEGKGNEGKGEEKDDDDYNNNALQRTCHAIGEWYKNMGVNNYYDEKDGRGLFTKWFEDQQHEINEMDEEFDADNFQNCEYVEFHEDELENSLFPLPKKIKDNGLRQIQFQIMLYCFENGTAPHNESSVANKILLNPFQDDCINLMVDDNETNEIMAIFQKLCPNLHRIRIFGQEDIKKLLAVGYKHNINLLSILTDVYNRDRMKQWLLNKNNVTKNLEVSEWVNNNKFIEHLTKKYKHNNFQIHIISAIESYIHRIVPKFRMPIVRLIDDNLCDIARYFMAASKFVDKLLSDGIATISNAPFQFDFCIAVAGTTFTDGSAKMIIPQTSDNDQEEEIETEIEIEIEIEADQTQQGNETEDGNENMVRHDVIGEIENRLKHEKCKYIVEEFDPNKYNDIDTKSMLYPRLLWEIYNQFITKNNINKDEFRGSRLCALIDRRKKITKYINYDAECPKNDKLREIYRNKHGNKKDDTYFWIPPNDCNKLGERHGIREIYFDRINQCIIPHKGYNEGQTANYLDDDDKRTYRPLREPITCKLIGGLIIFSFIVEAQDEISCYLWYQSQCIRFLPQDIYQILPEMFVHSQENNKFIKQQQSNSNKNRFDIKYYDRDFDHWYNKISNKATKKEK